jgi:hypothetical protein
MSPQQCDLIRARFGQSIDILKGATAWHQIQIVDGRRKYAISQRSVDQQRVSLRRLEANARCGIALWIQVYDERFLSGGSHCPSEIDGCCCFANSSLLVCNAKDSCHRCGPPFETSETF